jgi:hypothetical protein
MKTRKNYDNFVPFQITCMSIVKNIQNDHIFNKWGDIGYNFLIGGDGNVYDGRGWRGVGAHTRGCNFISIGIAFIGTFTDVMPTDGQINALHQLMEEGVTEGVLSMDYKLYGQRDFKSTESPGRIFYEMMKNWPQFEITKNNTNCILWN